MGIGVSLIVIAVGAILTWAVTATTSGLDVNAVGVILMFVYQSMRPEFFRRRPEVVDDYVAVHGAVPVPVPVTEGAVD